MTQTPASNGSHSLEPSDWDTFPADSEHLVEPEAEPVSEPTSEPVQALPDRSPELHALQDIRDLLHEIRDLLRDRA